MTHQTPPSFGVPSLRIAIVGGGLSGLATLYELSKHLERWAAWGTQIDITIFDPHGFDGRGVPYSPPRGKSPEVVEAWKKLTLTSKAEHMLPGNEIANPELDFYAWLRRQPNGRSYSASSHVPRYLFGDFLEEIAANLQANIGAMPGVSLRIETAKISDAKSFMTDKQKITLTTNGYDETFDQVFLATGHFRSQTLSELEGKPGYFRTVYHFDPAAMQPTKKGAHNLLIWGGENSIIDAIAMAEALGYRGKYTIVTHAADHLENRQENSQIKLPPTYSQFCRIRDHERGRIEILNGSVHDTAITAASGRNFNVPATIIYNGGTMEINLTAANLVNAALWERGPTFSAGHAFDEANCSFSRVNSSCLCTDLMDNLTSHGLAYLDSRDGMIRPRSPSLDLVGSPLMIGRIDETDYKSQSALHSWKTAARAVGNFKTRIEERGLLHVSHALDLQLHRRQELALF